MLLCFNCKYPQTLVVLLLLIPTQRDGEGRGTLPEHVCCNKSRKCIKKCNNFWVNRYIEM